MLDGHCLLHAWESTVLLAYPASRSLRPRWLCREPGLTSPPPVCSLFLSWGVPLVITVAAVTLKKIGYDASDVSVGWCWIDLEAEDRVLWMLLTGKVWEMLAYVTLPVLYLLIRKHINRAGIGNTSQGGANCIMFVLCTRTVRTRLLSLCCCCTSQPSAAAAESPGGPPRPLRPPRPASLRGPGGPQMNFQAPELLPS
ncbi:hypothetical protein ESR_26738, partial [Eschrichtius robustus]|nr:hypothetical protein [Eschrichtius robustus]